MKKWLIFAVIAAMFAMVMFPACGDKGGGDNGGAASNVEVIKMYDGVQTDNAFPANTKVVAYNIKWDGVPGYDYYVYYEVKDPTGEVKKATKQVKGQTLYKFSTLYSTGASPVLTTPFVKLEDADDKTNWSILACKATNGALTVVGSTATGGYSGDIDYTSPGGDHGAAAASTLWGEFWTSGTGVFSDTAAMVRIAVVANYPGGFSIPEQRSIVYSDWFGVDKDKNNSSGVLGDI
jgi:hypothetical protein